MKKTHPAFWAAGWAGTATSAVLVTIGISGSGGMAELAGGYGMLVLVSALYLLAGLKLRERRGQRSAAVGASRSAGTVRVAGRS